MLFDSWIFFGFFALILVLHIPRNVAWQNGMLLVASNVFYAYWDWRFLSLLWISIVVDYTVTRLMTSATDTGRRRLLITSLVIQLGILGFFKYFNFFADSMADLLLRLGLPASAPTWRSSSRSASASTPSRR